MPEQPHEGLLNRAEAVTHAELHYGKQINLLKDLANYGSNLVVRAYHSSPKGMADLVICGVLLKQVAAMTDATEVLISAGCGNAAFLPNRAAFEASIYLDWMLVGDSELKAKRYVVANYRDQQEWARRATPGSAEEAELKKLMHPFGIDVHANNPSLATTAADGVTEANRVLSQPALASIDQAFSNARKPGRNYDVEWYALDGLKSIRQVADKVGRLAEYDFFYSRGSQVMHTGTYTDHMLMSKEKGAVRFKSMRHLEDVHFLVQFTASICVGTYRKILDRYRPAERAAFNEKYLSDWREPFLNIVRVSYK